MKLLRSTRAHARTRTQSVRPDTLYATLPIGTHIFAALSPTLVRYRALSPPRYRGGVERIRAERARERIISELYLMSSPAARETLGSSQRNTERFRRFRDRDYAANVPRVPLSSHARALASPRG